MLVIRTHWQLEIFVVFFLMPVHMDFNKNWLFLVLGCNFHLKDATYWSWRDGTVVQSSCCSSRDLSLVSNTCKRQLPGPCKGSDVCMWLLLTPVYTYAYKYQLRFKKKKMWIFWAYFTCWLISFLLNCIDQFMPRTVAIMVSSWPTKLL